MINGSDLCTELGCNGALEALFPNHSSDSPVDVVRIACKYEDLEYTLPLLFGLKNMVIVVFNMQFPLCSFGQVQQLALMANDFPIDVLYFADSLSSLTPDETSRIVGWIRDGWKGDGIHTHDNMGEHLTHCELRLKELPG